MLFQKEEIKLLEETIPVFEKIKPSLISVLKAHSETNLSNLLAYLLKGEDYPQLQELCLPVLIEKIDLGFTGSDILNDIIDDGYKNVKIYTEYPTKFGRIDILIVKEDEISWRRRALIIENKLYHNLQNDLDDYFYSVSKREGILPEKIAVVVLSLKPFNNAFPSFMKSGKITHRELKESIEGEIKRERSLLNDRSAMFILNEYLMHIEDLYLERGNYSNEKVFNFYVENRQVVNSIVKKVQGMSLEDFERQELSDKEILYNRKSKINQVSELHKNITNYASELLNHYINVTERSVQGKDYFRGRGLSYDAIRYKLDFDKHFNGDEPIYLQVYLNGQFLALNNININDDRFQAVLEPLGVSSTILTSNTSWYQIYSGTFEIDETILSNILKESIEVRWGKLEEVLDMEIGKSFINKHNHEVVAYLEQRGGFEYKFIENNKAVQFAYSTTDSLYQYKITFLPPDLIEIVLYIANSFWEKVVSELPDQEGFLRFTDSQTYRIIQLKDVQVGEERNFDALFKKSYRIKSINDIQGLFEKEEKSWTDLEIKILSILNKDIE